MHKTIITFTFILAALSLCTAQKIEVKEVFMGYKYMQNNKRLNFSELKNAVKAHPQAFALMK